VSGLFPRRRGARGRPSNDVPFPSGGALPGFGSPPNPGPLTPEMARLAGADFSFASSEIKALGAFFCNGACLSFSRLVGRSRARSAARPRTTSCGFESSEPLPFPGPDSIFSSLCGAISGRLRFAVSHSLAIPATETPRFKRSTAASAGTAERGRSRYRSFGLCFITHFAQIITIVLSY
jgi:hypothetical protein